MVQIEGTYCNVRSPLANDFLEKLGQTKEISANTVGTHWSLMEWSEGGKKWGFCMTCCEDPNLNFADCFEEGVEKDVDHPAFGGKVKIVVNKTTDGFFSTITSGKFGSYTCKEVYGDDRITMTWTYKGDSHVDVWVRSDVWAGGYRTVKATNVEEYFKELGADAHKNFHKYEIRLRRQCHKFHLFETFGTMGSSHNDLILNQEVEFHEPMENPEVPVNRTLKLTKLSHNSFLMALKNKDGTTENWILTIEGQKAKLNGHHNEKNRDVCFEMEYFTDMAGCFKTVATKDFDKALKAIGACDEAVQSLGNDKSMRVKICDLGNGYQYHKMSCKFFMNEVIFKFGEEFEHFHPILKENGKEKVCQKGNELHFCHKGSKFEVKAVAKYFDNFVVMSSTLVGPNITNYAVYVRC